MLAVVVGGTLGVWPQPQPQPILVPPAAPPCTSDYCTSVTSWPWSDDTRYFNFQTDQVQLLRLDGSVIWTVSMHATEQPSLLAEGDFNGDGVPDYIFGEVWTTSPVQYCAGIPMSETQLVFVDGATGKWSTPVAPMLDICWEQYGYPTHQWGSGTAYIGHLVPGQPGNQVVVMPYFATEGWVLTFDSREGWRQVGALSYPSTPAFDVAYDSSNRTACQPTPDAYHCWQKWSHVANAIFVGGAQAPGLLLLTTHRAVVYRPDFTPTSDVVWSYAEGGGRDYGLVESHPVANGTAVTLIGGCGVAKTRDSMHAHALSADNCELFHHYEYFLVQGQSIVQHTGRAYGWFGTVGRWQDRAEFPFPSMIPLSGHQLWSVFNLYRDGQWRVQLLPDPSNPNSTIEVPGWYVWGSVSDRLGNVFLAATRTPATASTDVASYVPSWQFDLLLWSKGQLVSVAHHDGVAPSLVRYPPGPGYHASDEDTFGLVEQRALPPFNRLLVESANGEQSYVIVP